MIDSKLTIAVFTAWPDKITNAYDCCQLVFKDSVDQLLTATFASTTISQGLERYVARVHDRHLHTEFEYCLFVKQPVSLEIADLLPWIDSDHTSYLVQNQTFILYRRDRVWKEKYIDVESFTIPMGVIFIDCWQHIADCAWPGRAHDFDFYKQMKQILPKYGLKSLVFHTNHVSDYVLCHELQSWLKQSNAVDVMSIPQFQQHYQKINLQNWIVVGVHWQLCVHDRPLGLRSLSELKQKDSGLRIFSHMDCTVKWESDSNQFLHPIMRTLDSSDYEDDSLIWAPNGKLPELIDAR